MNNAQETRKQKRLETLGNNHPVCTICGEDDWRCIEQHHIAGRAYADELCNICRNCHRKLSDEQKDHPKQIGKQSIKEEAIGHFLIGLADFLALLVIKLKEFGYHLIQSAQSAVSGK